MRIGLIILVRNKKNVEIKVGSFSRGNEEERDKRA